ncbi:MAG: hypothetical protein AAF206_27370 [Bacteroidota bacterium]
MIFDQANPAMRRSTKDAFIRDIMGRRPVYLDFHGGDWFAEVKTVFLYQGKKQNVTLYLALEEDTIGSKWVFTNVYFEPFTKLFSPSDTRGGPDFIHPMSHELDFMNLIKVFENQKAPEKYANKYYQPDYLTLFLYEVKKGNLKFQTVSDTRFHFFQVENWYFEVSEFRRADRNRGWLISQMTRVPPGKKELLLNFIYHQ